MKVEDMTLAQVEAAEKFANEVEIFNEDEPLNDAAFVLFHTKRDHVFTKANWGRLVDPDYVSKKARWDEQHAKRESDPNKAALPAEDPEPKDPAADYPANSREQFPLWRERAIKETLAEKILTRLATRAEREGKSLTEAGAEYARFGVKVVRNDTPLTDEELVDKFPDPIVRDSDFDQTARNRFRAPPEGVVFKPVYVTQPVATTRIGERIRDRGMMVMRLESSDAARQSSPTEKREVVTEFWRKHKVSQLAKAQAEVIRAKADAAGPELDKRSQALRAAAAEMGLEVHTLRRFNNSTTAPKIPVAGPNEKLAPELEASARRVAFRNRVQQHYTFLSVLEPGKIVDQVVLDDRSQAAYAMLLTDKHEPTPLEMRDTDLRQERYGLAQQSMSKMTELTSYDALAKRFSLERFDPQPKKKSEEKKG